MNRAEIIATMDPRRWPWPYADADVVAYEARAGRLGAPCPSWAPSPADLADEARDVERVLDAAELDAALIGVPTLTVPDSPALSAHERLVLAAMLERRAGTVALITVSEIAARLYPSGPLSDDSRMVEAAVFGLVRRRFVARHVGGGFVIRRVS